MKREKVPFIVETQEGNGGWVTVSVPDIHVEFDTAAEAEKAIKVVGLPGQYRVIQVRRGPYTVAVEKVDKVTLISE